VEAEILCWFVRGGGSKEVSEDLDERGMLVLVEKGHQVGGTRIRVLVASMKFAPGWSKPITLGRVVRIAASGVMG